MQDQVNDLIRELNELSELLSNEEREESACHQELGSSVSSCDRCIRDAVAKQAKLQQINDKYISKRYWSIIKLWNLGPIYWDYNCK